MMTVRCKVRSEQKYDFSVQEVILMLPPKRKNPHTQTQSYASKQMHRYTHRHTHKTRISSGYVCVQINLMLTNKRIIIINDGLKKV